MKLKRSAGVLVHPTSFPTAYGIGDLGENAYKFIDFLYACKMELWQILPLGPTSFGDSPYQSFSTYAGNTMLISPDTLEKEGLLSRVDLENTPNFDSLITEYGRVIEYKTEIFYKAYENSKIIFGEVEKNEMKEFCNKNRFWLDDYALFVSLKSHFIGKRKYTFESLEYVAYYKQYQNYLQLDEIKDNFYGAVWNSWSEKIKYREKETITRLEKELENEIGYAKFLQYIFFKQWWNLKKYANDRKIKIIGDIPIFVALDSADVWANPELFYMDSKGAPTKVAGVPPDYFSPTGQLWGNPLYNWEKHKQTNFDWWAKRVSHILTTVDILRIDHFRGFDEYWEVKFGAENAIDGVWSKGPGKELFITMQEKLGDLPIIAEDLGVINESVEELRDSLGFPGMRVLQFAFENTNKNPYLPHNIENTNTVIYTGTHDNDTTVGWYSKVDESIKDHFRRYINVSGDDPAFDMLRLAFSSVAAISIVPIQDIMRLDSKARMNTPGVAVGNWQFRYTEDMLTEDLKEAIFYNLNLYNRARVDIEEEKVCKEVMKKDLQ